MGKRHNRNQKKKQSYNKYKKANVVTAPIVKKATTVYARTACDMHIHSMHSLDGALSVRQILDEAVKNNVKHFAIADHNSFKASQKALRIIESNPHKYKKLNTWTAVEVTCHDDELGANFHLLVYDFDPSNKELTTLLDNIRKEELKHHYAIFAYLEKHYNISFSPVEILRNYKQEGGITWKVIAEMAVLHKDKNGNPAPYAKTTDEFLTKLMPLIEEDKHLSYQKDALMLEEEHFGFLHQKRPPYPSLKQILKIVKSSNGFPVIAHPEFIGFHDSDESTTKQEVTKKIEDFLTVFKEEAAALNMRAGLEVFHTANYYKEKYYLNLAKRLNLIPSGGSDFHGSHKSVNQKIGTIKNSYGIKNLPIVAYLNSGRNPHYQSFADVQDIKFKIIAEDRQKYAANNSELIAKKELIKTRNLTKVLEHFGEEPIPFYLNDSYNTNIRRRKSFNSIIRHFNERYEEDKSLLQTVGESYDACIKNLITLQDTYFYYLNTVKVFERKWEKFQDKDNLENYDKFEAFITESYTDMIQKQEEMIKERQALYKKHKINPLTEYTKLKTEIKEKDAAKTDDIEA